jgi:hypothetical protein
MSIELEELNWRGLNPDKQINATLEKGLSEDKSDVNTDPVYRGLKEDISKLQYDKMWAFWLAYIGSIANPRLVLETLTRTRYKRKFTGSDIYHIDSAKHVTKAIGLSTPGKLDKVNRMPTVNTVRIKMRKLMSIYTRKTGRIIPQDVYDSMAPASTPAIFPFCHYLVGLNLQKSNQFRNSILKHRHSLQL